MRFVIPTEKFETESLPIQRNEHYAVNNGVLLSMIFVGILMVALGQTTLPRLDPGKLAVMNGDRIRQNHDREPPAHTRRQT